MRGECNGRTPRLHSIAAQWRRRSQPFVPGRIIVGSNLLLAASLVLGQAGDFDSFESGPFRRGTTVTQGRTYTRTYTQTWSSSGGWKSSEGWRDDRPSGFRLGDKISSLFGKKSTLPSQGWKRVNEDEEPEVNPSIAPSLITPAAVEPGTPVEGAGVEFVPEPLTGEPGRAMPVVEVSRPTPAAATIPPTPIETKTETKPAARPAPTRVALTPGGEFTIEVVHPDVDNSEVKPAAFDGKRVKSDLNPRFVARFAHAQDYSLIRGQLRVNKGKFEVQYATEEQAEEHGGRLPLEMKGDLSALQDGDLIEARGTLVTRGDGTLVYRPDVIEIIERK